MRIGEEKILMEGELRKDIGQVTVTVSHVDDDGEAQHWRTEGHQVLVITAEPDDAVPPGALLNVITIGRNSLLLHSLQAAARLAHQQGILGQVLAEVMREDYSGVLVAITKAVVRYDRHTTQQKGETNANEGDHQQGDAGAQGTTGRPDGSDAGDAGVRPPPEDQGPEEG